jgi:hypothetical protein
MLPFDGFRTRCTSLYTGKRRFFAIPYRLGRHLTLHLFWGLLGAYSAISLDLPPYSHLSRQQPG